MFTEIQHEMIPANLCPDIMILKRNEGFYHFKITKVSINPADPTHPIRKTSVRPIRLCDYEKYFSPKIGTKRQIQFMQAMGAESLIMVHDITKNPKVKKESKPGELTSAQKERAFKESKRKITVGDVEKLLNKE